MFCAAQSKPRRHVSLDVFDLHNSLERLHLSRVFSERAVETIRVAFSQTVAARAGCGGATQRMGTVRMDGASRDRFKIRTSAFASERAWGTGHGETAAPPI
jgi:hypothetical protein